jgi:hypothetical protein
MTVSIGEEALFQYYRFSLYNSPFTAHDRGCAIDLYPEGQLAPSPVAGEVLETRQVQAPPKPYAREHDYLILVDTGEYVTRLLHVEPSVAAGDTVDRGESLGTLVRAGFFAPWVPNHIHLGFRTHEDNLHRASGSLPLSVDVPLRSVAWDGTGTVVEAGETWALLDEPGHPDPGAAFVGLDSDGGVLDGGFPHYDGGGLLGGSGRAVVTATEVGTVDGRDVTWGDCTVWANGKPITGVALFCGRDRFGIKLVGRELDLSVGDAVDVTVECDAIAE